MFDNPATGFRPKAEFRILHAVFSLAFVIGACQTTNKPETVPKETAVMDAQKAIIRHALDSGKPEAAMESLRSLLREYPDDASLHNLMGITQLTLRNSSRAVKEFQIAFKADKQVSTGLNLSSAMLSAGENARAVRFLTQLQKQADEDSYAYKERINHNIGYGYVRLGNMTKAEQWFKKALDENPTFFLSHLELARLYEKTRRPTMAMNSYRRAMDYCVPCLEPVQALTALYVKSGRTAEARRILLQFGKLEGISPEDRTRAGELLNQVTLTGLPAVKRGG